MKVNAIKMVIFFKYRFLYITYKSRRKTYFVKMTATPPPLNFGIFFYYRLYSLYKVEKNFVDKKC